MSIVHKGRVPYLLKKSAKLRRNRKPAKQYDINFSGLNQKQREDSRDSTERIERTSGSHRTQTIEMEDEKEEAKEGVRFQRSSTSRFD